MYFKSGPIYGPKPGYRQRDTSKYIFSTLPGMLSRMLPIALDGTLPASLTVRSQVSSQDSPKYTSEYAPKYTSESLASTLSIGKTLPISLDYMVPCILLGARCRELLSCRCQAPGGGWQVAGAWLWVASGGRNNDVVRCYSPNLIIIMPTVTRFHDASWQWC